MRRDRREEPQDEKPQELTDRRTRPARLRLREAGKWPVTTKGELAIRANLKAQRAAAEKPESLNEAISNKMDEALANLDAKAMLKTPEDLLSSCGEVIQRDFRLPFVVDTLENPNMVSVIASELRVDLAACVWPRMAESAVDAAVSAQAANSLEKMLCHQLAAAHFAAIKLTGYSLHNSPPPVEMARLSNAAARMMQVFQEGLLTLQKLKMGGKQTVVVQHVQVSDGGQAVIARALRSRGANARGG